MSKKLDLTRTFKDHVNELKHELFMAYKAEGVANYKAANILKVHKESYRHFNKAKKAQVIALKVGNDDNDSQLPFNTLLNTKIT